MTAIAEQFSHIVGVDTHARTHTYAVIDSVTGRLGAVATFPTTQIGHQRAITWIERVTVGPTLAAVECTSTYGATLCRALQGAGIRFTEARPAKRTERRAGKSDAIDAEAGARSVLSIELENLTQPRDGKTRSALRILLATRRSLDGRRTADRNSLIALLRIIDLGIDVRHTLTAPQLSAVAAWRARPSDDIEHQVARAEAVRLARSVLTLTVELKENKQRLGDLVATVAPELLTTVGVGPVSAAVFVTAWSHPGRVRSEAAFASLAGASPLPASSGNTIRHRLNRQGDRQLNRALDVVARARLLCDQTTQDYAARRQSEGKTPREIRRLLKRYIARQVHRILTKSSRPIAASQSTGEPSSDSLLKWGSADSSEMVSLATVV